MHSETEAMVSPDIAEPGQHIFLLNNAVARARQPYKLTLSPSIGQVGAFDPMETSDKSGKTDPYADLGSLWLA